MLRAYFYKLFRSPLFYVAFLGTVILGIYSSNSLFGGSVYHNLRSLIGMQSERKLFIVLAALAFASNFADEWNSKTVTHYITRKNAGTYARANVTTCFFAAFISIFMGMLIYILIQSTKLPLHNPNNEIPPYWILGEQGFQIAPPLLVAFVFAVSCAAWSVAGLMLSAFFPSRYIAICAPLVFSYILGRVTKKLLPDELCLDTMSHSSSGLPPIQAFLLANSVFISMAVICGIIFVIKVKRRVENELG